MGPWLRFFRVVNLPTVPGDVLVGAAAMIFGIVNARRTVAYDASAGFRLALFAAIASVFLYMFGLADNDIVGAKKDGSERPIPAGDVLVGAAALIFGIANAWRMVAYDAPAGFRLALVAALVSVLLCMFGLANNGIVGAKRDGPERPIPAGEISLRAARLARGLCLFLAMIVGAVADLPSLWWIVAFVLTLAMVIYNRTKWSVAMGLCRGLNVACGVAALVISETRRNDIPVGTMEDLHVAMIFWLPVVVFWWFYITIVTKFSEGEEQDPAKRRCVGLLIGVLVYLQLGALLLFYLKSPCLVLRNLLLVGAGLLIALRLMKRIFPRVSAS